MKEGDTEHHNTQTPSSAPPSNTLSSIEGPTVQPEPSFSQNAVTPSANSNAQSSSHVTPVESLQKPNVSPSSSSSSLPLPSPPSMPAPSPGQGIWRKPGPNVTSVMTPIKLSPPLQATATADANTMPPQLSPKQATPNTTETPIAAPLASPHGPQPQQAQILADTTVKATPCLSTARLMFRADKALIEV